MIYLSLFFGEIVVLFFLSRAVSRALSRFLSTNLIFFILLPGVIIHELSHLFTAAILFVPTGGIELSPEKDDDGIRLGSVRIAKTDPIRRFVVGIAPVFVGIVIIVASVYFFSLNMAFFQKQNMYIFIAAVLILIYSLFAIGNTMFSSRADMKGAIELLTTILIVVVLGYFLGVRLPQYQFNKIVAENIFGAMQQVTLFLLVPIAIDLVILGAIRIAGGVVRR